MPIRHADKQRKKPNKSQAYASTFLLDSVKYFLDTDPRDLKASCLFRQESSGVRDDRSLSIRDSAIGHAPASPLYGKSDAILNALGRAN